MSSNTHITNKYKTYFTSDYTKAIGIIESNGHKFKTICNKLNVDDKLVKSIVFPETIRYNTFKDFVETSALEILYINQGSEIVDFSIGYFQMKPSFIEKLETVINKNPILNTKYKSLFTYSTDNINRVRETRLERLKNIDWQISYVCCFIDYLHLKYPKLKENEQQMISFYASAYNFGFKRPPQKIINWSNIKAFPYGSDYNGYQFTYSELALQYFTK
jgi:hypothetical protein